MSFAAPTAMPMAGYCPPCPGQPQAVAPQPTAPPAPTTPAAGSMEVNEALKKLSNSVDLLTKMVSRHTDLLDYQDQRLRIIESRVRNIPNDWDGKKLPKQ
jgi:hypothetical protein